MSTHRYYSISIKQDHKKESGPVQNRGLMLAQQGKAALSSAAYLHKAPCEHS